MKQHHFTLILARPESSEADADALYEAGCDDASISTSAGVTRLDFHRAALSLEHAISSALTHVRAAGFEPAEVRLAPDSLTPLAA